MWTRCAVSLLFASALGAQTVVVSHSRLDFGNGYRTLREDMFPNSRSASGNRSGDFLYKAFPVEVLGRADTIRVSGVRISHTGDSSFSGPFPVSITAPEIAFYPLTLAKIAGKDFYVPDLTQRASRTIPGGLVNVLNTGVLQYEVKLGPNQPDPRLRMPIELAAEANGKRIGWAVAVLANPGEKQGDGKPHFVCVPTFREIHRDGAPSAFSGVYDAVQKVFRPYGTQDAPSNLGELAIELLLDQPTLQVFSDASGGVRNDPRRIETHMGPGAYVNHLASAVVPGFFGLYAQWESKAPGAVWCMPLVVALGAEPPATRLQFGAAPLLWDRSRSQALTIFLATGLTGPVGVYKAGGNAGHATDQNGVYVTPRIPLAPDPALRGVNLWLQAVFAEPTTEMFVGSSNLVRVVF